jgi:chromosome segregation ATPase
MTKQKLQAELLEEVKEGVKPSDLKKKLKRSKSLGDIPSAPPLPTNQQQCKKCNDLQKQLDQANQDWTSLAQKGVENLKKDPNPRIAELEKELAETVKDATEEITRQETEIKQLRTKLTQVNNQKEDLTSKLKLTELDLNSHQRAAEFRLNDPFKDNSNWWEDYGPIILLLGLYALSTWLLNKNPQRQHYHE